MVEELNRGPMEEVQLGKTYNTDGIEKIITGNRWPKVKCAVCGSLHLAALQKTMVTKQGGEFAFTVPECPSTAAGKVPEE